MDAAEAMILHDEMRSIQASNGGAERYKKIQAEQLILLGSNPFLPSQSEQDKIKAEQKARQQAWEARKKKKNGQGNNSQANS